MRLWSELVVRLRAWLRRDAMERELAEEIEDHLAREAAKLRARGWSATEARREARRRFGGVERHREATREAWGVRGLEVLGRDLRVGVRRARKHAGSTAVAILTLALGIGGTTGIFTVVNSILVQPLPYPDAERLMWIAGSGMGADHLGDWQTGLPSAEQVEGFTLRRGTLTGADLPRNTLYEPVSEGFIELLGGRMARGRSWTPEEARRGDAVAVVRHDLWQDVLGGRDPADIAVSLEGTPLRVVGVLAPGFHNLGYDAEIWVPVTPASGGLNLIAKLAEGASRETLATEARALGTRLLADVPDPAAVMEPRVSGVVEQLVGSVGRLLVVLLGASAIVLLLACVNVATILLTRDAGRDRELAVRAALGAPRGALVLQLMAESSLLVAAGGVLGVLVGWAGLRGLLALAPPSVTRSLLNTPGLDGWVLGFSLAVTALAAAAAGLAPALRAARRGGTQGAHLRRGSSPGEARWRQALVVGEVALALVLLVAMVLTLRTYAGLRPASPGFEVEDRIALDLTFPGIRDVRDGEPPPSTGIELLAEVGRRVEGAVPGARTAAATELPLTGLIWYLDLTAVDGEAVERGGDVPAGIDFHAVSPDYIDLMEMRILHGRGLRPADGPGAPAVAVVNETAARRLWSEPRAAVGRRLSVAPGGTPRELSVVGVLADVRTTGSRPDARAEVYASYPQFPWPALSLVVHHPPGAVGVAGRVRSALAGLGDDVILGDVRSLESIAWGSVAHPRFEATLMSVFGGLATLLAVLGCHGVLAFSVAQRRREIGIRMALGASRSRVVGAVLAQGATMVGLGLVAGSGLAALTSGILERTLFGVRPPGWSVFLAASGFLALVSSAAAWIPARRAAAVHPATTLEEE